MIPRVRWCFLDGAVRALTAERFGIATVNISENLSAAARHSSYLPG
jgi:hypothetical protein